MHIFRHTRKAHGIRTRNSVLGFYTTVKEGTSGRETVKMDILKLPNDSHTRNILAGHVPVHTLIGSLKSSNPAANIARSVFLNNAFFPLRVLWSGDCCAVQKSAP